MAQMHYMICVLALVLGHFHSFLNCFYSCVLFRAHTTNTSTCLLCQLIKENQLCNNAYKLLFEGLESYFTIKSTARDYQTGNTNLSL